MLTLRGEHFYLWPTVILVPCTRPAKPAPRFELALAFRRDAECASPALMVWETSPPLVLATTLLRLFRAFLPLAMLWVSKLILDAVVGRILRKSGNLHHIWDLVALELGLAVLSDVLGRANTLFDSLLADRFTNRVSVRLMRHATELDLASFEDPVFYDKLERARRQTTGRLTLLASLLNVCQDMLSLISLSGMPVRLLALADAAPGSGGDPRLPRRNSFHHPRLLGSLSLDAPAPPARLPPFPRRRRPERQGNQDLRLGPSSV